MKFILFGILIICLVTRGAQSEDVEEFDPVEAMRSLLEQEVAEGTDQHRRRQRQQT